MSAPIRVGIIGFGTAGRVFHAPFIAADPEFQLTAIVTADEGRRAAARAAYPDAVLVDTPAALLGGSESGRLSGSGSGSGSGSASAPLDLVVVASPSGLHAEHALQAIAAGCSVVVDKPFAVTAAQGRAIVDAARAAGVTATVFQNRRWDGDFLTVKAVVASGELGDVHRFESRFEWWKPAADASWKSTTPAGDGGGILYDLGPHLIDQAVQLFGPATVEHAELFSRRPGAAADDDAFVALQHASGVRSHLWMNAVAAQAGPRFRILGSSGAFTSCGLDAQEDALAAGAYPTSPGFGERPPAQRVAVGTDADLQRLPFERGDYASFYRGLADAILRGSPPPVDAEEAVRTLELIETIHRTTTIRK